MAHDHRDHDHDHDHGHHHHHAPADHGRAFALAVALNVGFVVVEVVFGFFADSLALLADAGHNLGDVLGLLLAWGGAVLAGRAATTRRTYGLRRSSILAALANAVILLLAVGAIAAEAVQRLGGGATVAGGTVIAVALVGTVINTATALLFMSGRHHDLNIRGAFLHMAADAAVSVGVALSGALILLTGWQWLDPAVSLVIVLVIVVGAWGLLRESINLALDAVPAGIDAEAVMRYLAGLPSVVEVHDLHIWALSTTENALTAHLVRNVPACDDALLIRVERELHERFRIHHTTLQLETGSRDLPCRQGGGCGPGEVTPAA